MRCDQDSAKPTCTFSHDLQSCVHPKNEAERQSRTVDDPKYAATNVTNVTAVSPSPAVPSQIHFECMRDRHPSVLNGCDLRHKRGHLTFVGTPEPLNRPLQNASAKMHPLRSRSQRYVLSVASLLLPRGRMRVNTRIGWPWYVVFWNSW